MAGPEPSPDGPRRWFFDLWSYVYDAEWVQRVVYRNEHEAVLAALRHEPPGDVLDVGCGTGQLGRRLRAALPDARVTGCDFSLGMLHRALARDRGVAWVRGDAAALPFRDQAFDAVVSTQAFHWFPAQEAVLREFARVLRPGGRFLLTVVMPPLAAVRRLGAVGSRALGQPFRWMSAADLHRAAAAAGFHVERQRRIFRLPGALLFPPVLTVARRASG